MPSLLGQAALDLHRPPKVEAAYRQIIAKPGIDPVSPLWPLAHLGLARSYALQNRQEDSRKEYETFFNLWKDADTDPPVLHQARLEYDRLKSGS